jgi:FMN phosphatase YigB (HAD superfamily)
MTKAKKTIAQRQDEADYPALHDTIADLRKKLAEVTNALTRLFERVGTLERAVRTPTIIAGKPRR